MNKQEYDVLNALLDTPYENQRRLSDASGHSLGAVNRALRSLTEEGYLDETPAPTEKALRESAARTPKNAVILAAGAGMRMVPINTQVSKGLLEVHGEALVERLIKQLHEAGVFEIYVVVGFMKERYEYLMDDYGVKLLVNPDYLGKNNLHSLYLAAAHLSDTYIVPCDIWCAENPFRARELYSWYMVSDRSDPDSTVRVNRKEELVCLKKPEGGNAMIGICFLLEEQTAALRERMEILCRDERYDGAFWESALFREDAEPVWARIVPPGKVVEINTYEQLRDLDGNSDHLKSDALSAIAGALKVRAEQIREITVLKKGMTNRSFLFTCGGKRYIMRIPGEGTDKLIDRAKEAAVYHTIDGLHLSDELAFIDPKTGYKITEYLSGARVCDAGCPEDVARCMGVLREFHGRALSVEHEFDIFGQMEFYESLWEGDDSGYKDYERTKAQVLSLRPYIEAHGKKKVLTHIDANADNFLFVPGEHGGEDLRLIDWEYAGMQDPDVDIAMFCIYSMYDRPEIDAAIDAYYTEGCDPQTRIKIYCYVAACGLLWSNWCVYKRKLGVEFGEYSLRQYRYAKDYYRIVHEELAKQGEDCR